MRDLIARLLTTPADRAALAEAIGHAGGEVVRVPRLRHDVGPQGERGLTGPTGSGKTAAFGLGLLARLDPARIKTQSLVLCPTRELADQVGKQLRKLALGIPNLKLSVLCGGIPLGPQLASLTHPPHVVVGTPGRIQELAKKKALHLRHVRTLVLDGLVPNELVLGSEHARNLDAFAIVSSDADFTPLVMRLLTDGVKVYGFGEQKTPESFRQACRRFVYTENLRGGATSNQDAAVRAQPLQPPEAATPILKKVIGQMASEDGWVTLGEVGRQLANLASDFDQRTYGFRTLSELVRRTNAFEIEQPKGGTTRIRIKPAEAPSPSRPAPRRRAPRRRADQKPPE